MKKYAIYAGGIVLIGLLAIWFMRTPLASPGDVVCTADAKLCPDGSAVGRIGPNCEFAACPSRVPTTVSSTTLAIGDKVIVNGVVLTPRSLTEDSRCPVDVQCIQAGTVRVTMAVSTGNDIVFTLNESQIVSQMTITLASVIPAQKRSTVTVAPSDYRFVFTIVPLTPATPIPI